MEATAGSKQEHSTTVTRFAKRQRGGAQLSDIYIVIIPADDLPAPRRRR